MTRSSMPTTKERQTGFSLIEVLVALLVLSIGLLGLAALQATGFKYNSDAYYRTQASILAYDIIDRMRANPKGAGNGDYEVDGATVATRLSTFDSCISSGSCKCDANACSSTTDIATYDLGRWYEAQRAVLPAPGTPSTINSDGKQHEIIVRWRERNDIEMSQTWAIEF